MSLWSELSPCGIRLSEIAQERPRKTVLGCCCRNPRLKIRGTAMETGRSTEETRRVAEILQQRIDMWCGQY